MYLLCFHGSPRKNGNSEILLDAFLNGVQKGKADFEKIKLSQLKFKPCIECGKCDTTGECVLSDDLTPIYEKLFKADVIVIATPIFFCNPTSYVQAFFERFQALWIRRYKLNLPHPFKKNPKGILLSVGATKGAKLFEGLVRSFRYVISTLYGSYVGGLFFRKIDYKGEILKYPEYLEKAEKLGFQVATLSEDLWELERSLTP